MTNIRYTPSFDYNDLVNSLQTFMRNSDDFRDVQWDGSAAKALLRVLAYNTQLQEVANGFLFNELSLDSATIQENVNAIASGVLGYLPQGSKASVYYADIVVSPKLGQSTPPSITIDRSSKFFAANEGVALNFVADTVYTANLSDDGSNYTFSNVKLIQGNWLANSFLCQTSNNVESYSLPNQDIDINYLSVAVTTPTSPNALNIYNRVQSVFDLGPTNLAYFLSTDQQGYYKLEFGDDKLCRRLQYGEVILVDSLETLGSLGNNVGNVNAVGSIGGFFDITVTGRQAYSYGGDDPEDIETTRKVAPMSFSAQGSAVSPQDYVAITKDLYPEADSVASWGGELDIPAKYGYQIVAVKPKNSLTLSAQQKSDLVSILQPRCVGSISPIIRDPDYTFVNVNTNIVYQANKTLLSPQSLTAKVSQSLATFSSNSLEFFGADFIYVNMVSFITAIDPSFVGNVSNVTFTKKFIPVLNSVGNYTFRYNIPITPGSVDFVNFKILEPVYGSWDFHLVDDSKGNIFCIRINPDLSSDVYTYPTAIGQVNYATGEIDLTQFAPISILGIEGFVNATVSCSNTDPSLLTSQSVIIEIDKTNITFTAR